MTQQLPRTSPSVSRQYGTVQRPAAPRSGTRPPRIHGLDTLRALAVAAVVVYHLGPEVLPGGFIGVDVFFVLSGFLITTLLVRERVQTGRVSLRQFWTRRARRLLPALVTVVVTCTAVAGVIGGDILVGIKAQVLGALTFSSNWVYVALGKSYTADLSPQLYANFWSLAVEEQFYLFWPLVLLAFFIVRRSRLAGLIVTGSMAVGSAVLMAVFFTPTADPSRVYFGTDTHLFGLMAGAFFALWLAPRESSGAAGSASEGTASTTLDLPLVTGSVGTPRGVSRMLSTPGRRWWARSGLGLVSATSLVLLSRGLSFEAEFTYRGGLVLVSLCSVGLIAFLVRNQTFAKRVEILPVRWVGVRSYGIYLWHWPLLVLVAFVMGADNPGRNTAWPVASVALGLTVLIAWASYRFIEQPVMVRGFKATARGVMSRLLRVRGKAQTERTASTNTLPARFWLGAVGLVVLIVTGSFVAAFVRAPAISSIEEAILAGQAAAQRPTPSVAPTPTVDPTPTTDPTPTVDPTPTPAPPPPPAGPPPGDQITVIGDSVTLASVPALQNVSPGILVDAEVSRNMAKVPEISARLLDAGSLRPYVVISLATNSTVTEQLIDQVIAAVGPDHLIVLVTGSADRSWIGPTNDQIRAAAGRYPNVVVADWQAAASANPDMMSRDGVHPTVAGQELYAATVLEGLTRAHQLQVATQPAAGEAQSPV